MKRVICITGGMGSGKSSVCQLIADNGFPVYIADDRAKRLMHENTQVKESIKAEFGPGAYKNGELQRSFLAELIFADHTKRLALEAIVHPAVRADFEVWKSRQSNPIVFKESALVFEKGDESCDEVLCVWAEQDIRIQRIQLRNPDWTLSDIQARMSTQWTDEQRLKQAKFSVSNSGTLEELKERVDYFLSNVT